MTCLSKVRSSGLVPVMLLSFAVSPPGVAQASNNNQAAAIVYDIRTQGLTPPQAIDAPDPKPSDEGRKVKANGAAILSATVTSTGDVRDVQVKKAVGKGLDEKAVEAVRKWKFKPATLDGRPVAVRIDIEIKFHLY
jgi:TonB family protein